MNRNWIALIGAMIVGVVTASAVYAHEGCASPGTKAAATAMSKPQTLCPVMRGPINKQIYADYGGKRIYFCCGGCLPAFKENPEKYMKVLHDSGVDLEDAPETQK